MKYCSSCWEANQETAKYCVWCGVEIVPVQNGKPGELLTLYSGLRRSQVHMIESYLEWAGIPFLLWDEYTNNLYANAVGGISIQIPASELLRALEALAVVYVKEETEV